ncbi:MAG: DUF6273 domain-containing protein [Lachnospiraceae bacterium]|nr:DUF6273 domain-containing protein [Lachnospiraceae bacterium]
MATFKCKMCGGTIEFDQGSSVGVCDSCGTKQTLPRLDDDKRANLYDRANHFRRNNDFDKAMGIYEQILNEDNTDAEAYWSLVLCRYGIEYVEDPTSHKRIPTVNRAQFTSVFADEDYKAALQYADGFQRQIYEEEASTIDGIQKGILEISSKEEPFDVFICYKESDTNGRRTQDSVLATDLYHQLTLEGFKVFFSRITLEDKLGTAYEPYIFAALNSSKVMVVLGTKPEYFSSVWVKNEWSRYLALIRSGAKKMLIPAYRDMDPYDLPEEFSHLQAQDMSKLGFMQDLIRGVKKIISADVIRNDVKETVVLNTSNTSIKPLLERVFIFLEDGKWDEADTYCEKVLDIDPKNAEAYLGKLMAQIEVKNRDQLANCAKPFDDSDHYRKVLRFGEEPLKTELRGYIACINERNENDRLMGIYTNAQEEMKLAATELSYIKAANLFASVSGFKAADMFEKECRDKSEICRKDGVYSKAMTRMSENTAASYEKAIGEFQTILGWKDTDEKISVCQQRIAEIKAKEEANRLEAAAKEEADRLEAARKAEEEHVAAENIAKKRKKALGIGISIVAVCIVFLIVLEAVIIPNKKYNAAISLLNDGNIIESYESLVALKGYKDSAQKASGIFEQYKLEKLKSADLGDIILWGVYEQDSNEHNGKEAIEWIVLGKAEGKVLVISKFALDCREYDSSSLGTTWERCGLRTWLNGVFLNAAFSTEEKERILITNVSADRNMWSNVSPGNATEDKVFLLSVTEADMYFSSDKARQTKPTKHATANGVDIEDSTCWWWLRTPGAEQSHACLVNYQGYIATYGGTVNSDCNGVRPAMWISQD